MAKKTGILFAAMVLVMVLFTGCAGLSIPETTVPSSTQDHTISTTVITEPAVNDEGTPDIAGTILYHDNGIKVTVTGYEADKYGVTIPVLIENTSHRNVLVTTSHTSINRCMIGGILYSFVEAGAQVRDSINVGRIELKDQGITELSNIQFYLQVVDTDTDETIHRTGLLTLQLTTPCTQTFDNSGTEIYNNNGIRVTYTGVGSAEWCPGFVYFFVENNSGRDITLMGTNFSLNGNEISNELYADLRDNTVLLSYIKLWDLSCFSLKSVDEISTVSLRLLMLDQETNEAIDATDIITIDAQKP